jgi:2-keto-3-deoxy-L-rhamnonate aldolase RhmA
MRSIPLAAAFTAIVTAQAPATRSVAIELWDRNQVAFGIFVPNDPAARDSAYANPAYDFLFLNLEQRYDPATVTAVIKGLRQSDARPRKTLIVRIPPVSRDGAEAAKARIAEVVALGGDGVAVPHISSRDEAAQVLGFFRDTRANIWSPVNKTADRLAMLMIEDPGALAQANAIADLQGYSILACGIGSLTQALGGNREAAEAGNQAILAATKRVQLVNMLTATPRDVAERVRQGFLALIAIGPDADKAIAMGRQAARRP